MNDQPDTKLARIEDKIDKAVVSSVRFGKASLMITTMGEAMEFAKVMSLSKQMIRKDFRGNPEMCLAVCIQAHEWGLNPYAVASKAFIVNDMVSYESQLIHAVIESRAPIKGRLRCEFLGEGDDRQCRVYGTFEGETEPHDYTSPRFRNIRVKNSPLWQTDPDQQLFYYSTRAWARRHCPDVVMGIYTPEEAQAIEMEPTREGWKTVDNPLSDNPKTVEVERKNGNGRKGKPAVPQSRARYWLDPENGDLRITTDGTDLLKEGLVMHEITQERYGELFQGATTKAQYDKFLDATKRAEPVNTNPYPDAKPHLKTEGQPDESVSDQPLTVDEAIEGRMEEARRERREREAAESYDPETGEVRNRESEEEQEGGEAAAELAQEAPEELKEEPRAKEATQAAPEPKNAPAKPQEAPAVKPLSELKAAGYFQEAMATVANAVDPSKLNQWWRGDRQKRLKECTAAELEQLNAVYGDKFVALAAKE